MSAFESLNLSRPHVEPRGRARKPWLTLVAPPPGVTFVQLSQLHREQVHRAIAKRLSGRRGGYFAAAVTIDVGADPNRHQPAPYLFMASTQFRAPGKWCERIDVAGLPCDATTAHYYARPVEREVAEWAWSQYARGAPYKTILNKWGGPDDAGHKWGVWYSCRGSA